MGGTDNGTPLSVSRSRFTGNKNTDKLNTA